MHREFRVSSTKLGTLYGPFEFYCFNWGTHEEDNILCQVQKRYTEPALVRVQSACYTAEIFRSLDCDCHEQLDESLRRIQHEGGIFIYLLCDGRGAGLYDKVRGLELGRVHGLDTSEAYRELGLPQDPREYSKVGGVLDYFGVRAVRLLTNNPQKMKGLRSQGIEVIRKPLLMPPTEHSRPYLETKRMKMGYMLDHL